MKPAAAAHAPRYFPAVETHMLRSAHVSQTFQIQVMRPPQVRGEVGRVPVVYMTDGNAAFEMCKCVSWLMQGAERESPPFILVAIGYPGDSPCAGAVLRARDLAVPGCPDYLSGMEVLSEWEGILRPEDGARVSRGAEQFLRFIAEELIPFIERTYATVPGDRTYFGHSMGATFGLFTLFTRAELFRRYVISSPATSYHGRAPDGTRYERCEFLLERAHAFIASGKGLDEVRLYLSVGTQEQFEPLIANWEFTSSFYRLTALLRNAAMPGLMLMAEALTGETHTTAWPIAFIHGIQAVFGTRLISDVP